MDDRDSQIRMAQGLHLFRCSILNLFDQFPMIILLLVNFLIILHQIFWFQLAGVYGPRILQINKSLMIISSLYQEMTSLYGNISFNIRKSVSIQSLDDKKYPQRIWVHFQVRKTSAHPGQVIAIFTIVYVRVE